MEDVLVFADRSLQYFPVLQRVMGKAWAEECRNVVAEVVIVSRRMSGRNLMQETRALQNHPSDEAKAFFDEIARKRGLTELIDKLIVQLEAKMN